MNVFQQVSTPDRSSAAHAMETALLNPIVLRQVFTHLPVRFLLRSCSLVNKYWQNEARTYIRDHRPCHAFVGTKRGNATCVELKQLDNDFGKMKVNPFNGLDITRSCTECLASAGEHLDVELLYHNVLAHPFKYLRFSDIPWGSKLCPTFSVITKILQTQGSSFVEIQLDALSSNMCSGQTCDQILFFPRLKKLTVGWPEYVGPPRYDLLHELVKAAPNLHELWGDQVDVSTLKHIPENKHCAVRELILGNIETVLDAEFLIHFAQKCPTLHTCHLENPPVQAEIFERYCAAALKIWESSRHTLVVFDIKEPWSVEHPLEKVTIPFRFHNIKIVKPGGIHNYARFSNPSKFIENLFNSMDKIEEISPVLNQALVANTPSRFYNLVQSLHLRITHVTEEKAILKFSNSNSLTLRMLEVIHRRDEIQFSSKLFPVLESLLQHCFNSLESLVYYFECEVLPLDNISCPPLTSLTILEIKSCNLSEVIQCMKRMDVQGLFPKLKHVTFDNFIDCRLHRINHDEEEESAIDERHDDNYNQNANEGSKAAVVLHLGLRGEKVRLRDIGMIFRAVTELYLCWTRRSPIPYQEIWTLWPDLTKLMSDLPHEFGPYDSVFCGLHQEEIDELQKYSTEYLQTLQIVPIGPAITNLKSKAST